VNVYFPPTPEGKYHALYADPIGVKPVTRIDTDYLVVGAGAAGLAFADALIEACDADVVIVDRRHAPGGHWNDAYPFVRLHQPSAYYGVNSRILGSDSIDSSGPNAGWYERATAAEIRAYYQRVLNEHLLASDQVRFFGMSDCQTDGPDGVRLTSRLTGAETTVRVRRRVVDARYLEASVPATHTPSFTTEQDVRLIPVNDLVRLTGAPSGYTVIGGGKTGMDACLWLLEGGIPPEAIRWIRPREAWLLDRAFQQPLDLVTSMIEGVSLYLEASAQAQDVGDLFHGLEACGTLLRLDPEVEPTSYRYANVSQAEAASLRRIENIVRLGRVRHIAADQISLERGSLPSESGQVYVDCSATGLRLAPGRPVFEPGRITVQQIRTGQPAFSAALIGYLEAARPDDAVKNRLCPPNPYPDAATDWISCTLTSLRAQARWLADPEVAAWVEGARLNASRGTGAHLADLRMQAAIARMFTNFEPAITRLEALQTQALQAQASLKEPLRAYAADFSRKIHARRRKTCHF
jgi:NAD(P)-binding Rossmann-like domain